MEVDYLKSDPRYLKDSFNQKGSFVDLDYLRKLHPNLYSKKQLRRYLKTEVKA